MWRSGRWISSVAKRSRRHEPGLAQLSWYFHGSQHTNVGCPGRRGLQKRENLRFIPFDAAKRHHNQRLGGKRRNNHRGQRVVGFLASDGTRGSFWRPVASKESLDFISGSLGRANPYPTTRHTRQSIMLRASSRTVSPACRLVTP
jgi:hypothetical protein